MIFRTLIVLTVVLLASLAAAQTAPDPAAVTTAIRQLGDNDYGARQKATEFLWRAGPAIAPALEAALKNPDGEISARAQEILEKFKCGILPETPPEVADLARQYRLADKDKKRDLAYKLVQLGRPADEVLRHIAAAEDNADLRNMIQDAMASGAGARAADALAEGNTAAAENILRDALRFSYDSVRRDYAALALFTHKIDAVIADLEQDPHTLRYGGQYAMNLRLLAYCHRAKGNLPAALTAARALNDENLILQLQFEAADWPAVAGALAKANAAAGASPEQRHADELGLLAIAQVGGDTKAAAQSLARLKDDGAAGLVLAQALLTAGHVPEALAEFKAHAADNPQGICALFQQRGDFAEALALAQQAIKDNNERGGRLRLELVRLWYWVGEDQKARDLFTQAKTQLAGQTNYLLTADLIATARYLGLADDAFGMAAAQLKNIDAAPANPAGPVPNAGSTEAFLGALFPEDPDTPAYWYGLLHQTGQDPTAALTTLRALQEHTLADKDLRALIAKALLQYEAAQDGAPPSAAQKILRGQYIADTLYHFGKPALTREWLEKLAAQSQGPDAPTRLGDMAADAQDWAAAARYYQQAFTGQPMQPALLYLSGLALERAGQGAAGQAAQRRADLLLLAEETDREITALALKTRGYSAAAARQYEFILRLGDFRSRGMHEATATLAELQAQNGDYASALRLAQRTVADTLSLQAGPVPLPEALLDAPRVLYQVRAQQALAEGHTAAAQEAIAAAAIYAPRDMTLELAVIAQLDKAGQKDLADQVFARPWAVLQEQLKDYPNCPVVLNNLAWLCAKTLRHTAEGLAFAQRATALRPQESGYLDTLAEAQFVNGQVKAALETERRALQLTPDEGFFREQIERFSKAPQP